MGLEAYATMPSLRSILNKSDDGNSTYSSLSGKSFNRFILVLKRNLAIKYFVTTLLS
jgi:hypothetical protein